MILNVNLTAPDIFYIFVNHYNLMTVHNLEFTKTFTSAAYSNCLINKNFLEKYLDGTATYLPFIPSDRDLNIFSPYFITAINDYRIEYDAELCRKTYFSKYPSRLSAVYAFGDYETCQEVSLKYKWDLSTVKKFKLVKDELTRVIKVNMEIVSLARWAYKIGMLEVGTIDTLWKNYWNGIGNITMELPDNEFKRRNFDSDEIWEYLIEGKLVLLE